MYFWRYNTFELIEINDFNTPTYGTKPASFLAIYCLKKTNDSIREKYPRAAESIELYFCIDNLMTGADSVEGAVEHQRVSFIICLKNSASRFENIRVTRSIY